MFVPVLLLVVGFAAVVAVLRPLSGRAPVWPLAEPLPFALLAGAAIVLRSRWDEIPARFPVHFRIDGRPDGWAPRTPAGVYGPLVAGLGVLVLLALLRVGVAASRSGSPAGPPAEGTRRYVGGVLLAVELFVAVTFTAASGLALGATLRTVLAVVGGSVLLLLVGIAVSFAVLSRRAPDADEPPSGGWRAGGVVYSNAADPELWIPKRIGIGWTLNFAHPAAWWVLAFLLLAPLAVAAAIFVVAAPR